MTDRGTAIGSRREHVPRVVTRLQRFPLAILQLLFRISIAAVFWNSGLTKIASWQTTIALFRDEYRVPVSAGDRGHACRQH